MKYLITYAQNREDRIIEAFFPNVENGFYVDVGANHPIHESVTKLFYEKGWTGINIEPNEALYDLLKFDRPRDRNLKIGVSNKSGELKFTQYIGNGLSTFSIATKQEYENSDSSFFQEFAKVVARYKVPVKTLKDIFIEAKVKHIHFMKIDVEGFESEVLEGNDWELYRPEVICIEANHIQKDWRPLIAKHNYQLIFFDGLNNYYVAKEAHKRAELFSYPDQMLLRGLIVALPIIQHIAKLNADNKLAEFKTNLINNTSAIVTNSTEKKFTRRIVKRVITKIDRLMNKRLGDSLNIQTLGATNNIFNTPLTALEPKQLQLLAKSYRQDTVSYVKAKYIAPDPILRIARKAYDNIISVSRRGRS